MRQTALWGMSRMLHGDQGMQEKTGEWSPGSEVWDGARGHKAYDNAKVYRARKASQAGERDCCSEESLTERERDT